MDLILKNYIMIDPNELKISEESKELSEKEVRAYQDLESHIDESIRSSYTEGKARVWDFMVHNHVPSFSELKPIRKKIIKDILLREYNIAGWNIEFETPDYGEDYYEFKAR